MARLLLCDDSLFMRMLLRRILEPQGYEVVGEAANGLEAVNLYQELQPDLVTMDITMPVMDGLEATRIILEKDPLARIVMVTAMGQSDIIEEAIQVGALDFIVKPFEAAEVCTTVAKVLSYFQTRR